MAKYSKKASLSERQVKKWWAWVQENVGRDWDNIVFSHKTPLWTSAIAWAWSTTSRHIQRTVKHPIKVLVWECFSRKGFGNLFLFTDNLNAEKMKKIYQKALVPLAKKWLGPENINCILQGDNDSKHRSRLCTEWKAGNATVGLAFVIFRCQTNKKCLGIHKA